MAAKNNKPKISYPNHPNYEREQRQKAKRKFENKREKRREKRQDRLHPNYLEADPLAQLRKRAKRTVRSAYRPEMKALTAQSKREDAIFKKRQADLDYYKTWLTQRQDEWNNSQDEADAASNANLNAMLDSIQESYAALRPSMIDNAEPGVSDMSDYTGFDISGEGARAIERGNALAITGNRVTKDNTGYRGDLQENSRAAMAAMAAAAAGEHYNRKADIRDTKNKLRAERVRDRIAEEGRLLELEFDKAKTRNDIRLQKTELRIRKRALKIDDKNEDADRKQKAKQAAAERRQKEAQSKREEKTDRMDNGDNGDSGGDEVDRRKQKEITREYNSILNSGLSVIKLPKYQKILNPGGSAGRPPMTYNTVSSKDRQKIRNMLSEDGIPYLLTQGVLDIYFTHGLRKPTKRAYKSQGYIVPKYWR